MEGTWGRRVFGRIIKGETNTLFILTIQMETLHTCRIFVPNIELQTYPGTYKNVLDAMVATLESRMEEQLLATTPSSP